MSFRLRLRPLPLALAGLVAIAGCKLVTDPVGEAAWLMGAVVPAHVAPNQSFEVIGAYGRGACDERHPRTLRGIDDARIGLRLVSTRQMCIAVLVVDSVKLRIDPPFSLPFLVRFERAGAADSVFVVRGD
jgi:hypothetical protein